MATATATAARTERSVPLFRWRRIAPYSFGLMFSGRTRSVGSDQSTGRGSGGFGAAGGGGGGGFGRLRDAVSRFDAIVRTQPLPPTKEFGRVLSVVVRMRHYSAAIALIEEMQARGVGLNVYIWGILMNCLCRLRRVELGFAVLGRVLKLGFEVNLVMLNTLVNGLCEGGEIDRALRLVDEMGNHHGLKPSEYTYGAILKGALGKGKEDRSLAMELLRKWERQNCRMNVLRNLGRYANDNALVLAMSLRGAPLAMGYSSAILSAFASFGLLVLARQLKSEDK